MAMTGKRLWDLVLGLLSAGVAVLGLTLSIATKNNQMVGRGSIDAEVQKALLSVAAAFFLAILLKAGLRLGAKSRMKCPICPKQLLQQSRPPGHHRD